MLILPSSLKHPYLERLVCGMLLSMWIVLFAAAEFLKQIECLRIIADQDDFIGRMGSDVV